MSDRAVVTAKRLHLREGPSIDHRSVGFLKRGTIVIIMEATNPSWTLVRTSTQKGFVSNDFIAPVIPNFSVPTHGKAAMVNATRLILRSEPNTDSRILGLLKQGTMVEVLEAVDPDWIKVQTSLKIGYLAQKYITQAEPTHAIPSTIEVTSNKVGIHVGPNKRHDILGYANRDMVFKVLEKIGNWYRVAYHSIDGYILDSLVSPTNKAPSVLGFLNQRTELSTVTLHPTHTLPTQTPETIENSIAQVWNRFGGLVSTIAEIIEIPVSAAIAIVCTQCKLENSDVMGRMLIQFDNQLFYDLWGVHHPNTYHQHFGYMREGPPKKAQDQVWRASKDDDWIPFHSYPGREWDVIDFARTLDDTAALSSTRMGLSQIVGKNYQRIGYEHVQEMFDQFCISPHAQIIAIFDYIKGSANTSDGIEALRREDFAGFAQLYSRGNAIERYQTLLEKYVQAFDWLIIMS